MCTSILCYLNFKDEFLYIVYPIVFRIHIKILIYRFKDMLCMCVYGVEINELNHIILYTENIELLLSNSLISIENRQAKCNDIARFLQINRNNAT